jgi:DNA-binding transcriptional ArsR family regulator
MTQKPLANGTIEDAKKIALLATPIRTEIVTTVQALGGAATVAELAEQLGRPADGLYYHLRVLVRGGLLEEQLESGGRSYRLTVPLGQRLMLRYKPGTTANAKAVGRVAASMSRLAQRDFTRALADPGTVVEGQSRELWVARGRGWVDSAELIEINRLLERLAMLLLRTRPKSGRKLISLQWILAPLDARPARRVAPKKRARESGRPHV